MKLRSKRDSALEAVYVASHRGDLKALEAAEAALAAAISEEGDTVEDMPAVPYHPPAAPPNLVEEVTATAIAVAAAIFMIALFVALCAAPDSW